MTQNNQLPQSFKIATWNVNSIRVRLPQILAWLSETQPDILALQETKTTDDKFPKIEIENAGYQIICSGQKTFNGVAILSKKACNDVITDINGLQDIQRRILAATIDDMRIVNLYVPNGESVTSEKYTYKLDWLQKVKQYLQEQKQKYSKIIVLGDFNIAPEACDVHNPEIWQGQVLFSDPERKMFQQFLDMGFKDSFRLFDQASASFSWWDYRAGAFWRNQGLRIDHILLSDDLASQCISCVIDKQPRKNKQPSDHTPVMVSLKKL